MRGYLSRPIIGGSRLRRDRYPSRYARVLKVSTGRRDCSHAVSTCRRKGGASVPETSYSGYRKPRLCLPVGGTGVRHCAPTATLLRWRVFLGAMAITSAPNDDALALPVVVVPAG